MYILYGNKIDRFAENIVLNHDSLLDGSLWNCDTCQKVAGSIPNCFIKIFYGLIPSGCSMALGSTQPLTEMVIRLLRCVIPVVLLYLFHMPSTLQLM